MPIPFGRNSGILRRTGHWDGLEAPHTPPPDVEETPMLEFFRTIARRRT